MSDEVAAQIRTFGAGLIGFVGVVGLGGILILYQDGAAVKAPIVVYAPVDAGPAIHRPAFAVDASRAGAPAAAAVSSSPSPLLSAEVLDAAPPAVAARAGSAPRSAKSAASGGKTFRSPKLVVSGHLDIESSASSSASMTVSDAGTPQTGNAADNRRAVPAQKQDAPRNSNAVASIVHYGVSSREELMGRAAGPVYNFSGAEK